MSKIRILPEILSNKIAAGEVVERPASVVKELVENALDAGSTRVIIEVEKGGRSLIRVSDNGTGMSHDDALLAIERYATSKIYDDEDLFSIRTLGFRGEALPSIAAVSRFTLESRRADADIGTRVEMAGGKLTKVSEIGAPPGTLISVRQLFYNTPARRKFMKTVNTEMGHIGDMVGSMALGWPGVRFRLLHNGKPVKNWPAVSDPADRVADVLGQALKSDLHPLESEAEAVSLTGWVGAPRTARKTSRGIYVYVNGRFVRDRTVQHALFEGYAGRLMKGQFPLAVLFITVPPEQVDVNVHPAKNEVRFSRQKEIHQAIVRAVGQTLQQADQPKWAAPVSDEARMPDLPSCGEEIKRTALAHSPVKPVPSHVAEPSLDYAPAASPHSSPLSSEIWPGGRAEKHRPVPPNDTQAASSRPFPSPEIKTDRKPESHRPVSPAPSQSGLWQKRQFGDLRIIGQFHGTYILCESESGLILIDQHAAHERVVFEQLKKNAADAKPMAQALLIPETIDLNHGEAAVLRRLIPDFGNLGLEVEPFGGNTFVVKAVPTLLDGKPVEPLIAEIVEKMADVGESAGLEKVMDECLMLMACHGAIRANQSLSGEQMRGLLAQLDQCDNPSHCPHGRPTWIKWTTGFLEKSFCRVV